MLLYGGLPILEQNLTTDYSTELQNANKLRLHPTLPLPDGITYPETRRVQTSESFFLKEKPKSKILQDLSQ